MNAHDRRVLEPCRESSLALELRREAVVEELLEGHFASEATVAGAEHATHAPAADLAGTRVVVDGDDPEVEELFAPGAGERLLDLICLELAGEPPTGRTRLEMLEE